MLLIKMDDLLRPVKLLVLRGEYIGHQSPDSHHEEPVQSYDRTVSRFAPSQWEMVLLCNDVSHWLGASLESALYHGNFLYDIVLVKSCW